MKTTGFLGSLFDLSFSNFITPKIIGVLYVIILLLVSLGILLLVINGFSQGFFKGLFSLILSPLIALVWLLLIRIALEGLVAGTKTAENTAKIAEFARQIRDK
jgi:hypothetical protein